jgi:hypothetical protein
MNHYNGLFLHILSGSVKESEVILIYSRFCPGGIEWAKYLHKLFTELSKHKGKLK